MVDEYLMKSTFCQQLRATLIRNLKLKIRDSRKTTAEVFLPFYTLGTLIVLKIFIPNPNFPAILHPSGDVRLFEHFSNLKNQTIAVLPHWNSSKWQTSAFLETVNDLWLKMRPGRDISPIKWMMYESQEDLLSAYWRDPYSMPLALVFHSEDPLNGPLKYEIRTNPSYYVMPSTTELYSSPVTCRQSDNYFSAMIPIETGDSCPVNQYYYSGFIALQYLLDYAKLIISSQNEYLQVPNITLEIFPKEAHTGNWMVAFRLVIPIYMVMALSQFITYLLILVVGEKESHIREGLKIMGLRDSVYWVAWFIIYAVFVTFLTIVSVILLFSLSVFQHTNYLPVFILVLLYSLSVILIGFMITPFFDNSRTAGILGNFIVNIMSLLYFIQVFIDNTDTSITLWIISIISPTGFALAMDKILVLDISGQGVTLNNLFHISGEGIPLGGSVLMLLFDVILYAMLAFYLDAVIPGDHGTKQSPCFCLSKNYWFEKKVPKTSLLNGESASSSNNADEQLRNVEPVSRELRGKEAIKIVDLYKTFQSCRKPEVNAVNGINLTIYQGQITAILGHNGAGKSTLFNILTGMCLPTNGTAYIFGYDVRDPNDMAMIRRMTGVCPQHDILFDQLTAKEHLYFFAAIRGIPKSMVEYEVKKTLIDCDLYETAADTHSKNLSGGQKRKLSVGIAIIGDPKIIILDEPTAGVDPYSRRHMWSLLQKRKSGKVILLTTHFMDEADILADRKAVISKGRLRCCGSSLFLKNKFGVGYHLTLVLETNARETTITKLVKQHVTQAKRARHHGRELSYILPHDSVDFFAGLFMDIEFEISTKMHHLGIISYGVSMTTLEEVFLQLETDNEQDNDNMSNSENFRKRMIKNPALRRSISLQGRTSSYHSLQNENCRSTTLNNCDISSNKGTIRSLPDKCSTFNFSNTACDDSENLNNNSSINNNHLINTSRSSLFENDSNESPVESKGKTSLIQSNNHLQAKSSWLDVNSIQLVPSNWHTTAALLKLRLLILIRDLQKLYLMIILPLGFAALGLYLNSIQVIIPVMRSIVLDNNTYGQDARIAVYDSTTNEQSDGYNKFINELNKLVDVDEEVDGNYSSLLNISPHMAALNVNVLSSSQISITVLYNDTTQHSLPVILNILSNTLYRLFVDTSDYQNIEIRSHPFQQTSQPQGFNIGTLTSALFIGMIFILIPVSLAVDMVYDREMKAKNQLRVNGLSIYMYFLSYCIVLTGLMVIICAALLGLIYIFDVPSFRQPPALITLGILVTLYSPAAILCSTCFSYFFDRTDSAQSILPNILTFVGLIPFCLVALLDMLEIEVQAAKALHYTFSLCFPPYISYALVYFVDRVYVACTVNSACADLTFANYMTNDIIIMIVGVLLHIPIWLLCLRIVDVKKSGGKLSDIFQGFSTVKENDSVIHEECYGEYEDEDVRNERSKVYRICNGQCPADPPVLIVKNLRKEYKQDEGFCNVSCSPEEENASNLKVAVRCLSFTADSGEILGLLGHNGAGKTTTMRMITGEMVQTMGSIRIGGHDHTTDKENAFKNLGYCPQHDALWKNVTIREHLELYATIRGVPKKDIPRLINTYLHGLQINEHANKQTQHCSGGTRRKLSYAMAIIGTPKVVLLDEPSTGMDPKSKRLLWDTILSNDLNIRGAIILTTHSMEEADALCSRVGIMVKGEMRCLGSTQHLKNLYGAGYTLEIKLKHFEENYNSISLENVSMQTSSQPILFNRESQMHSIQEDRLNSLKNFIIELFPDACLEESFADRLVYSVPQHAVNSLAQCFSNLEKAKTELNIEEYSFSQTTLEQVFLKFAHFDEENATIL